jgi:hypothetical protein
MFLLDLFFAPKKRGNEVSFVSFLCAKEKRNEVSFQRKEEFLYF